MQTFVCRRRDSQSILVVFAGFAFFADLNTLGDEGIALSSSATLVISRWEESPDLGECQLRSTDLSGLHSRHLGARRQAVMRLRQDEEPVPCCFEA